MKRNFQQSITALDGSDFRENIGANDVLAALAEAIKKLPEDQRATIGQHFKTEVDARIGKPLTLKLAAVTVLTFPFDDERALSGDEKMKRAKLAMQIYDADGEIELKSEDIALIKRLAGKYYSPLPVMRIYDMLEE